MKSTHIEVSSDTQKRNTFMARSGLEATIPMVELWKTEEDFKTALLL
jgi:hypothetical protein